MSETLPEGHFDVSLNARFLRLLTALGATGNLRRAAREINISQPAATKLLRRIEETVQVALFVRTRRGMTPTLPGEAMIRNARVLLADLDQARRELAALAIGASGRVSVGKLISTAATLLPRSVAALQAARPGVQVSIVEATHDLLLPALKRGELDLVIGRATNTSDSGGLVVEPLYQESFCLVCRREHPIARRRRLSPERLAREAWILPPRTIPLRLQLDAMFLAANCQPPSPTVECVSNLTQHALLLQTDVIGVMPAEAAEHYVRLRRMKILPMPLDDIFAWVVIMTREGRPRSPAVTAFIAALKTAAAGSAQSPARRNGARANRDESSSSRRRR